MSSQGSNKSDPVKEEEPSKPKDEEKIELTEEQIAEKTKKRAERLAIIMGPAKEQQHKTIGNYAVGKKKQLTEFITKSCLLTLSP